MIRSFADADTERLFLKGRNKRMGSELTRRAKRKLQIVDQAATLRDLASPPGNRLEALHGDRQGQHSVRINDQYRVCFRWDDGDAYEVEVTDYH